MKNKLNAEEQLLRDKLNQAEADFNYQESNWQEMQQVLPKKGVLGKYGTLLKAGIGFALMVSLAYLVNTGWESNDSVDKTEQAEPTTEQAVVSSNQKIENEQKDSARDQTPQQEEAMRDHADKVVLNNSTKSSSKQATTEVKSSKINPPTEKRSTKNEVPPLNLSDQQTPELDFNLEDIVLEGKTCIGNTITATAKSSGSTLQNIHYKWLIDNKNIFIDANSAAIELTKTGRLKIEVYVLKDQKTLASREIEVQVPEKVTLDFTYNDLESPYDDLKALFKASPEGLSNLKWSIKDIGVALSGNEVSYEFDKKGVYDLSLSHESPHGCITEITKPIAINKDFNPLSPTDFTPNGDELNDTFIPVGFTPEAGFVDNDQFRMSIYDFNGKLVYTTTSNREAWNGQLNNSGNVLPEGSYVWKVELKNAEGQQANYAGKIRLRY